MPMEPKKEFDVKYKVLLLGDSGVGKTALIRKLTGQTFNNNLLTTIGIDFVRKIFEIDGAKIQLEIWDTAGQERFRSISRFQYRGTKGLLLVYDVTRPDTFETMNYWLESIDKDIDKDNREPIPVYIVGNKCDLKQQRVISREKGRKLAEGNYVHGFIETSAKEGTNVHAVFEKLALAVAEINNPKLMNAYLNPFEKSQKLLKEESMNNQVVVKPTKNNNIRFKLKKWKKKSKVRKFCCMG